jgi:hypothetical protein
MRLVDLLAELYGPGDHGPAAARIGAWYASASQHLSRFERRWGGAMQVWEDSPNNPKPEFWDWITDRLTKAENEKRPSPLPPRVCAKRMLYNSLDKGDGLAADLWDTYQDELKAKAEAESRAAAVRSAPLPVAIAPVESEPTQDRDAIKRAIAEARKLAGFGGGR